MARLSDQFAEWYRRISRDPIVFAEEAMRCDGEHNPRLTDQQVKLLRAVQAETLMPVDDRKKRIAVKSGQGTGKTTCECILALWRAFWSVDALVVITAPTMNQIRDVWIAEMRRLLMRAHPFIQQMCETSNTKITIGGRRTWGIWSKAASRPENFQGFHQKYLTFIVDEASGVDREIFKTIKGTLTNPNSLLVCAGNPNCVVGSSMIYDPQVGYVTAEQLAERGECDVVAMAEDRHTLGLQSARAFYSGEKECCAIETWAGQRVELSTDHPVYTQRGWIHAGLVQPGDWVATPRQLPEPSEPVEFADEDLKLLAYALTDAHTRHHFDFTQMPGPVLDEFSACVRDLGGDVTVRDVAGSRAKVAHVVGLTNWLKAWGLWDCVAQTKRVPAEVFRSSNRQVALFLNRFWSCDGSFHGQGPKLTMCNRQLVQDVQTLLLRLGIHARIRPTRAKPSGKTFEYLKGREFQAWTLSVYGAENLRRWREAVGEVLGKEGKCPEPNDTSKSNCDVVPLRDDEFLVPVATRAFGPGGKGNRDADPRRAPFLQRFRRRTHLSRTAALAALDEAGEADTEWRRWAEGDLLWVEVESVTPTDTQAVYDLTVPERGNFVCDNVIVHNTRECAFFDMFHKPSERELWHLFTFNSAESPITDKENIRRLAQEFGTNSDTYRVRVLGEFPLADPNCVMSSDDLWACTGIPILEAAKMRGSLHYDHAIGIDVARFGSDESVIYRRSGLAVVEKKIFARTEPTEVVEEAMRMQRRAGWRDDQCVFVVDAGGMGQGVLGLLHRRHKRVHEFLSQHKASTTEHADKITEAYFHVGRLARERRISIPSDEHLIRQLSSRLYKTDSKGKLKLESKDDYMKRMEGESPDRADALVMAFYDAVVARARVA